MISELASSVCSVDLCLSYTNAIYDMFINPYRTKVVFCLKVLQTAISM